MCLFIKNVEPVIAEKDITCYKILKKRGKESGNWHGVTTPYRHISIGTNVLTGKQNLKATDEKIEASKLVTLLRPNKFCNDEEEAKVEGGFIHTYAYPSQAQDDFSINGVFMEGYMCYECVIPKGTEYFKGKTWNGYISFASREIKFVSRII